MNNKETIKKLRGKMTQEQYSEFLGVSIRTIQNWEYRGTSKTTEMLLWKINELEEFAFGWRRESQS